MRTHNPLYMLSLLHKEKAPSSKSCLLMIIYSYIKMDSLLSRELFQVSCSSYAYIVLG